MTNDERDRFCGFMRRVVCGTVDDTLFDKAAITDDDLHLLIDLADRCGMAEKHLAVIEAELLVPERLSAATLTGKNRPR